MRPKVYLAGPVTGESFDGATTWRDRVSELIEPEMVGYSPLRTFDHLLQETKLEDTYDHNILSTQRGIFARCTQDVDLSNALFVNLLGANRVSIGTVMELSWAWDRRIPTILVMENEGNVHEHAMIREACPWRADNIEDGVDLLRRIMLP